MGVTRKLAEFAANTRLEMIPAAVQARARDAGGDLRSVRFAVYAVG